MAQETKQFKTEVQELLHLMIHSLYSNKDIFLRELVANSADAIDKARFESITNPDIAKEWEVRVETDKDAGTLSIIDNGIGMSYDEVAENIGTIAKSGTKAFAKALEESKEQASPELIGQFGVGFYSAFMVAEKVVLETKKAGSDSATKWESKGESAYSIEECDKEEQGTKITLFLAEDNKEYLDEWKVRSIIRKYSDYIEHPIKMQVTKQEEDPNDKEKKIDVIEDETLNSQKAIWVRSANDVTEEEHKNFFNHISPMGGDPLVTMQYAAEGTSEFKALLYIPTKAPFDMFTPDNKNKGLQLYIRRVFITDECKDLIPDYLRFVKGVVDSSDLPLNVSREILQDNPKLQKINKNLVKRVLSELKKLQKKDNEKYLSFYNEFGKVLKEGLHSDFENKDKLQDLVMFESMSNAPGKLTTLKEYAGTMPESQKEIYYIIGENRNLLENSPHLEFVRSKGFDVLFMTDPIDEFITPNMTEYDGKKLKALGKGDIELDEEEKKANEEKNEEASKAHKNLVECIQKALDANVKEVKFSQRLTDSACCLVSDQFGQSAYMEKIMKQMGQAMPPSKRILELNASHPIVEAMQGLYDKSSEDVRLNDFSELLYDQALIAEGSQIPNPLNFTKKLSELMVIVLNTKDEK